MKLYQFAGELQEKIVTVRRDGPPVEGHVTLHCLLGSDAFIWVVPTGLNGKGVLLQLMKTQLSPKLPELLASEFSAFWTMTARLVW